MAHFKSNYPELGFYCCGEYRQFNNGEYVTEEAKEIEVIEKLVDAVRIDKAEAPAPVKTKAQPKTKK
jgi:hypothetical protein